MTGSDHGAINKNVVSPFSLHQSNFLYDRYIVSPCFRLSLICGEFRLFSCLLRLHQQGGYVGLIDLLGLFSTKKKERLAWLIPNQQIASAINGAGLCRLPF